MGGITSNYDLISKSRNISADDKLAFEKPVMRNRNVSHLRTMGQKFLDGKISLLIEKHQIWVV